MKGMKKMEYKYNQWNKKELDYFNRPIMKAERTNDLAWWGILVALIVMEAMVVLKVLGKI